MSFTTSRFFLLFSAREKNAKPGGEEGREGEKKNNRGKWDGAEYFNLHTAPERRLE